MIMWNRVPPVSSAVSHTPPGTGPEPWLSPPSPSEHAQLRKSVVWPDSTVLPPGCQYPAGADETCIDGEAHNRVSRCAKRWDDAFWCKQIMWITQRVNASRASSPMLGIPTHRFSYTSTFADVCFGIGKKHSLVCLAQSVQSQRKAKQLQYNSMSPSRKPKSLIIWLSNISHWRLQQCLASFDL